MKLSAWPLHLRAAAVATLLLLAVCAAMVAMVRHFGSHSLLQAGQQVNLQLAHNVVQRQPGELIDAEGRPRHATIKELAMHVMVINPSVEVYLLDAGGRVLAHALDGDLPLDPVGQQVDLAPLRPLLQPVDAAPALPVLGEDPRRPGHRTIVSVAPVVHGGATRGHLYIVLQGEAMRAVASRLAGSEAMREMAAGAALVAAVAVLVMFTALRHLTRPLRELAAEVDAFRSGHLAAPAGPARRGDEIAVLRRALQALQQRVAEQFTRLEQADAQRRELVGSISHDLRTPLASVRGYVETVMLRGDALDAQARARHLGTALRQADQLERRVRELFELSKLDAARIELRCEPFCMAELLQDVAQAYQLPARERGVRLALDHGPQGHAPVQADIAMIERVLQNLIDNALRFTAAGGSVTLAVAEEAAGRYTVSVADTGRGIAAEHLPHIFDRYWRAGPEEELRAGTSSGLGLAIAQRMLALHGSVLRVHSRLAEGSRFEFTLAAAA